MRISTLARIKGAIFLAAVVALVPQYAFAQLPVETRELKLQGSQSGSLILKTAETTAPYTLVYPGAIGGKGSFLFIGNTSTGEMVYTNTPSATLTVPRWNNGTGVIEWVDPTGASNPNWSLSGNTLAADGTLGTKNEYAINIQTNSATRMTVASDGVINVNTTATGGTTTNIGRTGHTTNIDGEFDVDGAVRLNADESSPTDINTGTSSGKVTIGSTNNTVEQNASVWDVNAATATIDATTSLTVTGTTAINNSGTSTTNIGTGATAGTVTIGRTSGTLTTIGSLGHTGTATITGATQINTTGAALTTIGNTDANATIEAGVLTVNAATSATISGLTNINNGGSAATNIGTGASAGIVTLGRTGGTLTTIGSLGHTGTSSFTGSLTLAGANSPLIANTGAGTSGDVLISQGANNTPAWTSLADATGVRARGKVTLSAGETSKAITGLTGVLDSDVIIVTMQGTSSAVVATVTAQASGGFTVTFASAIPTGGGTLNYLVMKP